MPSETEIAVADAHMQRIVSQIENHEKQIENLRIEYWGYQAFSTPITECDHDVTRFCTACGNNS